MTIFKCCVSGYEWEIYVLAIKWFCFAVIGPHQVAEQAQSPEQKVMPLPSLFFWEVTIHTRMGKRETGSLSCHSS